MQLQALQADLVTSRTELETLKASMASSQKVGSFSIAPFFFLHPSPHYPNPFIMPSFPVFLFTKLAGALLQLSL